MSDAWSRRDVMRAGVAAAGTSLVPASLASRLSRRDEDRIRVGLIGCGRRGTEAAFDALRADPATRVVAAADLLPDRLGAALDRLEADPEVGERVEAPEGRRLTGFDAYERLLGEVELDVVILACPPHFRPMHFEAAVEAGVHALLEAPAAVDPVGVRRVVRAARRAAEQKLSVIAGTARRRAPHYRQLMERINDGAIGELVSASCAWNDGGSWVHERKDEYSDMEWQVRNWPSFCWLSGDHICERHVHNLDIVNWAMGGPPARATGVGGRQVRTEARYGNVFDHFGVEYEYPSGVRLASMVRRIDGCAERIGEHLRGTVGSADAAWGGASIAGENEWSAEAGSDGDGRDPYRRQFSDLIASVRGDGVYLNEAERLAESTMTAILGRMSAYSGEQVTWEGAMASELDLSPQKYAFADLEARPVAKPGRSSR